MPAEFILDTNAYRLLIEDLTIDNVYNLAKQLQDRENALGHKSALSIVVSMELIQHLEKEDPARERCFKALCLQWYHTKRISSTGNANGSFYPPMNVIISQYFFGDNSEYLPLYFKIVKLVHELTKNLDINDCDNHFHDIELVKNQVLFEKNEFKENVEMFLKSLNEGELDWTFIKNDKVQRREFMGRINDGRMESLLGAALLLRAHQILKKDELDKEAEVKLPTFIEEYRAALKMNITLLQSIGNGAEKLSDVNDKRWNTINDVQILFGALYKRDGIEKKLVTNEKKIKESCVQADIGDAVITLDDYKAIVGL